MVMAEGDWDGLEDDMRRLGEGRSGPAPKRKTSKLWYVVPAVALAVAGAVVYFFFYSGVQPFGEPMSVQESPVDTSLEGIVTSESEAVESSSESVPEQPKPLDCPLASLSVRNVSYDPASEEMSFLVQNDGREDFAGLLAEVYFPDGTAQTRSFVQDLKAGESDTFTVGKVYEDYESLTVTSIECLTVSDMVERIDIIA